MSDSLWSHGLQHARLSFYHQLPELTQTHVPWVGDTIQPSHPLLSPSPPAFNLSQHQGLFQWVSSSHQVAKVLEFELQHQSFQWFPLEWTGWISWQSKGLSRVFSNTTVQKHQFFGAQLSSQSNMTTGKNIALTRRTFVGKGMSLLFNILALETFVLEANISWMAIIKLRMRESTRK